MVHSRFRSQRNSCFENSLGTPQNTQLYILRDGFCCTTKRMHAQCGCASENSRHAKTPRILLFMMRIVKIAHCCAKRVFAEAHRVFTALSQQNNQPPTPWVLFFCKVILGNLTSASRAASSRRSGLSPHHFGRCFVHYPGMGEVRVDTYGSAALRLTPTRRRSGGLKFGCYTTSL